MTIFTNNKVMKRFETTFPEPSLHQFLIVDKEKQKVTVHLKLKNLGPDPAWNSELIAELPRGCSINKTTSDPTAQLCSLTRNTDNDQTSETYVCPTGISFLNGHIKEFKLGIDIGSVRGDVENLEMKFSMRSRSELQDTAGSKADIRLPVKVHGSVNSFNPRATPSYG